MKFKILIKRCEDPDRAANIAEEIAKWSGTRVSVVSAALMTKDVCVKKEAEQEEAYALKAQFESYGAEVVLEKIAETASARVAASMVAAPAMVAAAAKPKAQAPVVKKQVVNNDDDDDDDEDGEESRLLTTEEFLAKVKTREDIFVIPKERRLASLEGVFLVLGIISGIWFTTIEIRRTATDFFDKMPTENTGKFVTKEIDAQLDKPKEEPKQKIESETKTLKQSKSKGAGGTTGGGGDPRARVTKQGVLGIISGQVKGKYVASADVFGKGGFASGIDAILSGVGGLAAGGGGGVGRKGAAGIGYGAGYGSGFGGGGGGIDDLIGGLMSGDGQGSLGSRLKGHKALTVAEPSFAKGGALTGGRSMASIRQVVMQNLPALRYAYVKRLREKPGLQGKITLKFAIDEFGNVIFCSVVNSAMADPDLEEEIKGKIKRWAFGKIDKPGDVTEVIYPFVFSQ